MESRPEMHPKLEVLTVLLYAPNTRPVPDRRNLVEFERTIWRKAGARFWDECPHESAAQ